MLNIGNLDSMTKYPSIPTYHPIVGKGRLSEPPIPFTGDVVLTEKVDGMNGRIIIADGDFFIGTRDEIVYAAGDRLNDPRLYDTSLRERSIELTMVEALQPLGAFLSAKMKGIWTTGVTVFFFEVFGTGLNKVDRNYATSRKLGLRLFDSFSLSVPTYYELMGKSREHVALWREHGKQPFINEENLVRTSMWMQIPLTPRLGVIPADRLPVTVAEGAAFLDAVLPTTQCALDEEAKGESEGLVIRTADRKTIAKLHIARYRRTLQMEA